MPKTKLNQPQSDDNRKRLHLAEKSNVYDISNLRKSKRREEINSLLAEAVELKPRFDADEIRLKEIRTKLFEYAAELDTNGFKNQRIGFQFNGLRTRKTLSTVKLMETVPGITIEMINDCYVESDEYPDTKFVVFDPPIGA